MLKRISSIVARMSVVLIASAAGCSARPSDEPTVDASAPNPQSSSGGVGGSGGSAGADAGTGGTSGQGGMSGSSGMSGSGGMSAVQDGGGTGGGSSCDRADMCADGSCKTDHTASDDCGCDSDLCQVCLRGECSGADPLDFGHGGITVDGTAAFMIESTTLGDDRDVVHVWRLDDASQTPVSLAELELPISLDESWPALTDTHVYFEIQTREGRDIYRVPKTGGELELLAHEGDSSGETCNLKLDDTHIYWRGESGIWRMPLAGGTPLHWQHIACGHDLTVTHGWVYFSCIYDALLYRRRTSESQEAFADGISAYIIDTETEISGALGASDPIVAGNFIYYLEGSVVVRRSLPADEVLEHTLPFAEVDDVWLDGARMFVAARTTEDADLSLFVFPHFGATDYELIASSSSSVLAIYGATEQWLYMSGYRIPRP